MSHKLTLSIAILSLYLNAELFAFSLPDESLWNSEIFVPEVKSPYTFYVFLEGSYFFDTVKETSKYDELFGKHSTCTYILPSAFWATLPIKGRKIACQLSWRRLNVDQKRFIGKLSPPKGEYYDRTRLAFRNFVAVTPTLNTEVSLVYYRNRWSDAVGFWVPHCWTNIGLDWRVQKQISPKLTAELGAEINVKTFSDWEAVSKPNSDWEAVSKPKTPQYDGTGIMEYRGITNAKMKTIFDYIRWGNGEDVFRTGVGVEYLLIKNIELQFMSLWKINETSRESFFTYSSAKETPKSMVYFGIAVKRDKFNFGLSGGVTNDDLVRTIFVSTFVSGTIGW
ncbi:MAG: hypothetical protein AB1393_06150 [Candidatus Edwardsbacteria bacterium]